MFRFIFFILANKQWKCDERTSHMYTNTHRCKAITFIVVNLQTVEWLGLNHMQWACKQMEKWFCWKLKVAGTQHGKQNIIANRQTLLFSFEMYFVCVCDVCLDYFFIAFIIRCYWNCRAAIWNVITYILSSGQNNGHNKKKISAISKPKTNGKLPEKWQ